MTFFRRLRLLLLRSNKFTQYLGYAIGEIVLVMLGILIALQLNNWNQERQRAKEEVTILQSLLLDLESAREQSARNIAGEEYDISTYMAALGLTHGDTLPLSDTLAYRILWDNTLERPVINTYTELKNSGRFGLIENEQIRARFTLIEESQENLARLIGDRLTVQQLRIDDISESQLNFIPLLKRGFPDADYAKEHDNDYRELFSRPNVRNLIGMKLDLTHTTLRYRRSLHREIEALSNLIEEELAEENL